MLLFDLYEGLRARLSLRLNEARFNAAANKAKLKLAEALVDDIDNIVDPLAGTEGWIGAGMDSRELNLATIESRRKDIREIIAASGLAESALDSVADYVVGTGLTYQYTTPKTATEELEDAAELANEYFAEFAQREKLPILERSFVRCADRDGEAFLRLFELKDGIAARYVDPSQVYDRSGKYAWGVKLDETDEHTITGYFIDGEDVDSKDVLHIKLNVDPDIPRGYPTLWPIRNRVLSAERIVKAVGSLAEVQAKFAVVQKLQYPTTQAAGTTFLDASADKFKTDPVSGNQVRQKRIQDGSIVTISNTQDLIFPSTGLSIASFPPALVMQIRMIAVRLGIPDFAISGDTSGANFASMFVGMAPSTKRLGAKQAEAIRAFSSLHVRVLRAGVRAGDLPEIALALGSTVTGPEVSNRDEVSQTNVREVLFRNKILSARTWAAESGYNYDEERTNIDNDELDTEPIVDLPPAPPAKAGATSGAPTIDPKVETPAPGGGPPAKPGAVPEQGGGNG